jgi:hypothetical protein
MAYLQYRPTQTLFQYTTVDGLFGILKSKKMWLSDLRRANDPREIDLGFEKIIEALKSVAQSEHRAAKAELLSHLIERLTGYFQNVQVFCTCFSLAVDELPMWAAYGQTYSGLALGFRPAALLSIPARVLRVNYLEPSNEAEVFKKIALDIATGVDLYFQSKTIESWIAAGLNAVTAMIGLKHQTWGYEKEVRVVYIQQKERPQGSLAKFPAAATPKGEPLYWREPHVRVVGNRSVNYVEFPFGRFQDGKADPARALKTIIIGPNCPLSIASVESELKEQGFQDCVVQKSRCHIRL